MEATFVETPDFTKDITRLLKDEEYRALQAFLLANPVSGALIPGGRGLRKLRWAAPGRGKGKRGGLRVIYYYLMDGREFWMLCVYAKQAQEDLTPAQKKALTAFVERAFHKGRP